MNAAQVRAVLHGWRSKGWLRALDLAFVDGLLELDPQAPGSLLAASALLTALEGQGHSGLPLALGGDELLALLGWPAEAAPQLHALCGLMSGDGDDAVAAAALVWAAGPLLEASPADDLAASPLVLDRGVLYLRRYWRHERQVAAHVRARRRAMPDLAPQQITQARTLLDRLFGVPSSAAGAEPDWQKVACALALRHSLSIITGGPGTGKTYTAARLLVLLQALQAGRPPLRVALAAPTGKAAARLRQSIEAALQGLHLTLEDATVLDPWSARLPAACTLHALLGTRPGTRRLRHDAGNPLELDLLLVDEASMVHLEMMDALLEALPDSARLVLLGDQDQLASVEAGAVLAELCQGASSADGQPAYTPDTLQWIRQLTGETLPAAAAGQPGALSQQTTTLRASRRFAGRIGQLAQAVNRSEPADVMSLLRAEPEGDLALVVARDPGAVTSLALAGRPGAQGAGPGGYRNYLEALDRRPADPQAFEGWALDLLRRFESFRVLCAVREGPWGVAGVNTSIERALAEQGLIRRSGEWYEGRPVMVTRNDPTLGVFNGDIGLVLRAPAGRLRACFGDGERLRWVSVARLSAVQTAYAMTVHKSQGSEFAHVVLVLPDGDSAVLTRELVYTGITRARRALTVVADDARRLATAGARRTRRLGGLAARL